MTQKELNREIREMERFGRELAKSKEKSLAFFVDAGILTQKGNLRKPYKHLWEALGMVEGSQPIKRPNI